MLLENQKDNEKYFHGHGQTSNACVRGFLMVPMVYQYRGTIGNTICTNGNANGTIGSPNGTIGKPMVPLATNGTIGKITNGTIERIPNRADVFNRMKV